MTPIQLAPPAASTVSPARQIYIGRQPIFDASMELVAYELLFRSGEENWAAIIDGDNATFTVMLNALIEMGLPRLVGDKLAFINLTRNSVLCEYAGFFPKDQVVMEVLEDVAIDDELIARVERFHRDGYCIALDDFVHSESIDPLLRLAHIIKVDIQALEWPRVEEYAARHKGVRLLAEKVETREEFERCRELGFQYFQGYYLERPQVLRIPHVPACQQTVLRCLMDLHSGGATMDLIAETISLDPSLTYRLLRTAGGRAGSGAIGSIMDAVRMMGMETLSRWITLLSISGSDDTPHDLLVEGMARGFACREYASTLFPRQAQSLSMCGLLSVMPSMLGASLDAVLRPLDIREDLVDIFAGEGPLGRAFFDILAVFQGGEPASERSAEEAGAVRAAVAAGRAQAGRRRIDLGI